LKRKKIHNINTISYPDFPPSIIIIFENNDKEKYDNASLYQDILEYANDKDSSGFKFIQLGNWLMKKNKEFVDYYSGSKGHTPISARIAYKRQRIQNCINNLIKWNFLIIYDKVKAEKNNTQTPLYTITAEGKIIFLIIKAKLSNDDTDKCDAIQNIIYVLLSLKEQNDSVVLFFIIKFFAELLQNDNVYYIIKHFTERILRFDINNGHDFLSHLLGIKYLINWFVVDKNTSFKILNNLNDEEKKIFLYHLKSEIEYYYQENYLVQDSDFLKKNNLIYSGGIPSVYWESKRIEYIESFSNVVVPAYCNKCNSHKAFVIKIENYLESIIASYGPNPSLHVSGVCIECNSWLSSFVKRLPWGSAAWE
jgi:hypothetical protein